MLVSFGFLPNYIPFACALTLPSLRRDRIKLRSNSASPASMVSISFPWGVVVSAHVSLSERNPAFRSDRPLKRVQEVQGAPGQPIEPSEQQHVPCIPRRHGACQGWPIGLRAALPFSEWTFCAPAAVSAAIWASNVCACVLKRAYP
jgi:hypothetical protein